jgi:quercetin dioxygenase-like cupin family protein
MIKRHVTEVRREIPSLTGTKECTVQWLIAKEQGAQHYAMRLFTLEPGGIIPLHEHEITEHEIFIVQGTGILDDGKKQLPVRPGDSIFIQPGEKHSFENTANKPMQFICVVPL